MTEDPTLIRLTHLREAVSSLCSQVDSMADDMNDECLNILYGTLGVEYATHIVNRMIGDLKANPGERKRAEESTRST